MSAQSSSAVVRVRVLRPEDVKRVQTIFADGNSEYPVVADAQPSAFLRGLGAFKQDQLNAARIGALSPEALRIMQRAGWR